MNAIARERVEVRGHRGNEGFTLARFHFGYSPLVKYDTAHKLNAEGTLAQHSRCRLAYGRKCIGKNIVERFAAVKARAQRGCHVAQSRIAHSGIFICQSLDLSDRGLYLFYLLGTVRSEYFFE